MDDDEYPRYISLVGLRDALSHRQFQGAPCSRISHSKESALNANLDFRWAFTGFSLGRGCFGSMSPRRVAWLDSSVETRSEGQSGFLDVIAFSYCRCLVFLMFRNFYLEAVLFD